MSSEVKHTETPYRIGLRKTGELYIATPNVNGVFDIIAEMACRGTGKDEANAKFICQCCNSHQPLVDCLKELVRRDDYGSLRLPTQAKDAMVKALKLAEKDE